MEQTELKKELRINDWLVFGCFALMIFCKISTIFTFAVISEESGAKIESVATTYEGNPIFKGTILLGNMGFIISTILLPACAVAYYLHIRKKVLNGLFDINSLSFFVTFTFFITVMNTVNDGALLFGKLYQMGMI